MGLASSGPVVIQRIKKRKCTSQFTHSIMLYCLYTFMSIYLSFFGIFIIFMIVIVNLMSEDMNSNDYVYRYRIYLNILLVITYNIPITLEQFIA